MNLTLTRVVFESTKRRIAYHACINLTLTRVVFEYVSVDFTATVLHII